MNVKRPCFVKTKDGDLRALFHCWSEESELVAESPFIGGHPAGCIRTTFAIVEYENGQVAKINPSRIKFIDGGDFDAYCWGCTRC